jgi:hypothetical protein
MELNENILQANNNNVLLVTVILCSVVVCVCVAAFCYRRAPDVEIGKLLLGKQFVNVGNLIFPDNDENESRFIEVAFENTTFWRKEFVNRAKDSFVLKTEIEGIVYAVVAGSPGYASPWRCAYVAPIYDSIPYVVFDRNFHAKNNVWPEDANSRYLGVSEEGWMYWNTRQDAKLKFVLV